MREVAAHEVGGEIVLAQMTEQGKATCYLVGNHQYVRIGEHVWDDTTGFNQHTILNGKSSGKVPSLTIQSNHLLTFFSNALEDVHQEHNCVWDISDARVMRAHVDGLTVERTNRTQLMIGDTQHSAGASKYCLIVFGSTRTRRSQQCYIK